MAPWREGRVAIRRCWAGRRMPAYLAALRARDLLVWFWYAAGFEFVGLAEHLHLSVKKRGTAAALVEVLRVDHSVR